jgi:hypothetical protein
MRDAWWRGVASVLDVPSLEQGTDDRCLTFTCLGLDLRRRTFRHMQCLVALIRFPAYRNGSCIAVFGV